MARNIISEQIMFTQDWKAICSECGLDFNKKNQHYLSEDGNRIIKYEANTFGLQDLMIRVKLSINELL